MESSAWLLKGAGNANLVMAYSGQDPNLAGSVLRLRMKAAHQADQREGHDGHTSHHKQKGHHHHHDMAVWQGILPDIPGDGDTSHREEHYTCKYLTQWISLKYIPRGVRCIAPEGVKSSLQNMGYELNPVIPAQLFDDLTLISAGAPTGWQLTGPTLCAEIKPKAGCIPPSTYMSEATASLKSKYPRFVLHALLKAVQGKGELSGYNPLDLFSGNPECITAALKALMAAPNNNLRVFIDGRLIWGASANKKKHHDHHHQQEPNKSASPTSAGAPGSGQPTTPKLILDPATAALRLAELDRHLHTMGFVPTSQLNRDGAGGAGQQPDQQDLPRVQLLTNALQQVLSKEEVLQHVLAVQQQDALDVEGAAAVYEALRAAAQAPPMATTEAGSAASGPATRITAGQDALDSLRGYLTAATAKDCGIMVALRRMVQVDSSATSNLSAEAAVAEAAPAANSTAAAQASASGLPDVRDAVVRLRQGQERATGVISVQRVEGKGEEVQTHWMYQVTLLDLDLKSTSKIPVHLALDQEIVACAVQYEHVLQDLGL